MIKTEYKVNEEKRTVVCIITTVNDVPKRLEKYGLADEEYDDIALDVRVYKGFARCSPEDTWDETYGRRLAEYRASRARQVDVNNELKKYVEGVDKCLNNLCNHGFLRDPHKPRNE